MFAFLCATLTAKPPCRGEQGVRERGRRPEQGGLCLLRSHLSQQFSETQMGGCPGGVFAPVWVWVWGLGSTTDSQGVREFGASKLLPKFSSSLNSLGRAVSGGELDLGYSVFIVQASGPLCCVWGRLFVFILHFFSEEYDFLIRVKSCQMSISDFLEITRFWNLLKHKCQKKITAEFVWPFLFYSLILTFLVC